MHKCKLAILANIILLSLVSSTVLADGMILPGALSPDYLIVRSHHVTVHIEDNHAVTRVVQEFHNPHDMRVEGRYLFPVPPDAMLSSFTAEVDGWRPEVIHQDGAATNATLYDVLTRRGDPSLLRYADWDSLAFNLSLPPGGTRRMTLEYEELLLPQGGLTRYRYVLSTERYSAQPLEEVSVTVSLGQSSGLATLYSSSHPVTTERIGPDKAHVTWQAEGMTPMDDFELYFAPAEGGFGGGFLTGRREGRDHFLFLFSPQLEPLEADVLPKDIVFVLDRSGSMAGEKMQQAQAGLRFILQQLGEKDRFAIVSFNDQLSLLDRELLPVDAPSLRDARHYVDYLFADGWTDLEGALQAGLGILGRSKPRRATRMIVFLTDGLPTAGVTDEALIARLVGKANRKLEARLHVFGVGYDVNTHLLDRLAADNGGTVTYVQPGEDLEAALTGFYGRIAQPLLTDVVVSFRGIKTHDVLPRALPDLFQGSSLLLAGRFEPIADAVTIRVSGWAGSERRQFLYRFDLDETADRDFVPRLWATRRVGELLDRVRVEGESAALVDEIRRLGIGYGLVTPYTTFVIASPAEGAASAENMALYGQEDLNWNSGRTTIQARVQNQAYQQAAQAGLAMGSNVANVGSHSLAQVGWQNIDLSLLRGVEPPDGPISADWIADNVAVDRTVQFGSEDYFALVADPEARPYLQSGSNLLFRYKGQVISVEDGEAGWGRR